jgi:hypothetical protein
VPHTNAAPPESVLFSTVASSEKNKIKENGHVIACARIFFCTSGVIWRIILFYKVLAIKPREFDCHQQKLKSDC